MVQLRNYIRDHKLIFIDEAQRVENIGISLKLIHDHLPDVKLFVTGSSSLELSNSLAESLTGRKWENMLYPLSFVELAKYHGHQEEIRQLENRLIYGSYPDLVNEPSNKERILTELTDSYLYKDILNWAQIKKSNKLERLLQLLAFQIGKEVSYNELGIQLGLDHMTIQKYIDLLEKSFVLFTLPAFSRNLRNEIKKSRKIFFVDLGVRNSVIKQWAPLNMRNDVGQLWENYLMVERKKQNEYQQRLVNMYFWRTHAQQEIDLIEERNGVLTAAEFKWSNTATYKWPAAFHKAYSEFNPILVNRTNYADFIS